MKNIVLIGFMGCGKSIVAEGLSSRLKRELVSTDLLIESKAGETISNIFEHKGEAYFRSLEQEVIQDLAHRQDLVIDCGGGVVLNPENLKSLKAHGIVFYLKASIEVIYERIKKETHRPLLNGPDPLGQMKKLYQQRLPLYDQADYTIDANNASIEGPIVEILKKI